VAIPAIRHDHSVPLGHRAAFDGRSSRFTRSVALLAAAFTASLESVFGAMSRQPGPLTRGRWGRWLVSQIAMWGFLIYPISDLSRRGLSASAAVGAGVAVAVFALAWLATMWLALATTTPFRLVAPWLGTATVVGVPLAFGIGTLGFVGVFIYLSIAAAVSLPMPATLPAIGTATGAAALLLAAMASPVSADTVLGQLSLVFWLGIMMWFYRRMSLKNLQLRRAREELARLAVTEERLRFARDLHDLLGHSLSTISLKAQLARRLAAADPLVAAEIADIESITRHALIEVREAVAGYRTTTLADELDTAHITLGAAGMPFDAIPVGSGTGSEGVTGGVAGVGSGIDGVWHGVVRFSWTRPRATSAPHGPRSTPAEPRTVPGQRRGGRPQARAEPRWSGRPLRRRRRPPARCAQRATGCC